MLARGQGNANRIKDRSATKDKSWKAGLNELNANVLRVVKALKAVRVGANTKVILILVGSFVVVMIAVAAFMAGLTYMKRNDQQARWQGEIDEKPSSESEGH